MQSSTAQKHYRHVAAWAFTGLTLLFAPMVTAGETSSRAPKSVLEEPSGTAGPPRVRVLTQDIYTNTVAYIFGADIKVPSRFPPVARTAGLLAIGATSARLTAGHIEQYMRIAQAVADPDPLPACVRECCGRGLRGKIL
jgi:hypothetical protein